MRKVLVVSGLAVMAMLVTAEVAAADNKPKGPKEDGTMPSLVKIAGEGMMNSHAYQYLTELSDDIGSRLTGSPSERKSEEWAAAKMKAMGLENVHTEKYTISRGWTRGTADAKLLSPMARPLHVDAMGWVGSTPSGGADGDVVTVDLFNLDEESKNLGRLKGKIVLVQAKGKPKKDFMMIFADFGNFLKTLSSAGVVAVIGGQGGSRSAGMSLTHTGILGFAETIMHAGLRPRRTLRFVLFTGEEQGLDGSFAYYKEHKAEWANHLGDLILDEGQGIVKNFQLGGRDDLIPAVEAFTESVSNLR